MNRNSIHISIPTPCHESWDNMAMTERGAFCQSCQKEVIDFSAMTDREVVEYLAKHHKGCGRFRPDQVDTRLSIPKVDNGVFRWRSFILGFLPFLAIKSANASITNSIKIEQVFNASIEQKDTPSKEPSDSFHITGRVTDEKGEGMLAASIAILDSAGKSTGFGTFTDINGNFSMTFAGNSIYKIRVFYIGLHSQTITISESQKYYSVQLKDAPVLGEIAIRKPQTPSQKIKYWFRHTFRIKHKH